MAIAHTPHRLSPLTCNTWRFLLLLALLSAITACGVVDYSLRSENFAGAPKDRPLGTITFHYADDAEPYVMSARRVNRGYALQAPLYENGNDSTANIVASRTKDYKYFVGVQAHYAF